MQLAYQVALIFLFSTVCCFLLMACAPSLKLMAEPGAHRQHKNATPMVGGIAITLSLCVGILWQAPESRLLLPSLLFIACVGVVDDRFNLPSWLRFIAQAIAAYSLIKIAGIELKSLGFLVSPNQEVLLNQWSTPLTIFAMVGVINAINMSDGMDGLAGSMVALVLVCLLLLNSRSANLIYISLAAVAGFLIFNMRILRTQARVFLGDAGSTMLGLLLAALLVELSQQPQGIAPVTALWLLALPLIDAVAVLIARPLHGRSPFSADNSHYHHKLLSLAYSVSATLTIALSVQIVFIVIGIAMHYGEVDQHLQLALFLLCFVVYLIHLYLWMRPSKRR